MKRSFTHMHVHELAYPVGVVHEHTTFFGEKYEHSHRGEFVHAYGDGNFHAPTVDPSTEVEDSGNRAV